jgi:cell division protein ZapA (FtsZ GTPase activity inhibitor)
MRIELLGTSFTLQSDEDPDYVTDLVDFFKSKIEETRSGVSTRDPLKLAILSALLVTDELFKERSGNAQQSEQDKAEVHRIASELIAQLDETIPGETQ